MALDQASGYHFKKIIPVEIYARLSLIIVRYPNGRWACSQCERTFATKQNLRTHERLHSGDRPFACPYCDRRFNSRWNLKCHVITHAKQIPSSETLQFTE
ncbi:AZF1-like protein [Mya arenaria]|uniref:AZF1-like protein n=1 Tax=Mya arenaria TaxID=6604 RepID=A0ABY7F564_MYAAR|nr:AZF1-like protein [Mya arenaria]